MSFCVNIKSPIFKETAKRLDISEVELELIAHEYINAIQDGTAFPDDSYIQAKYSGTPMVNATVAQKEVWKAKFSTPQVFKTMQDANAYIESVKTYLDPESIGVKTRMDGNVEVRVAKPEGTKVLYRVYQGRKTTSSDGRPYNYYTASSREAKGYGSVVEERVVDTDKFLVKLGFEGQSWTPEYEKAMKEFKSLYGETFDILDNSPEGMRTQEAFFKFLEGKGYKGLDLITNNPSAFVEGQEENAYIVTFDSDNSYTNNNYPRKDELLFSKKKPGDIAREANLRRVKQYYTPVVMERATQKVALAQFYYNRLSKLEFDVNDPDFGAAEMQKFEEVRQLILDNKDLFPSFSSFYAKNGKLRITFAPITFDSQINTELSMFDSWSDASLEAELQRLELDASNVEREEDIDLYINPKKRPQIEQAIKSKNPFIGEEALQDSLDFLEQLENTPDSNQFVDCCIRWIKNNTISIPRDVEKVKGLFDLARKANMDTARFKNPLEMQVALVKEFKATDGDYINPDKYAALRFNHSEEIGGKLVQIYDVEDDEHGRQAVCQILADASPKNRDGKPIVGSPWCLSTFNYDVASKRATPTESSGNMWAFYSKGKRQIAICEGKPVAFNSSSSPGNKWWNFRDSPKPTLTEEHIIGVTDNVYETKKASPEGFQYLETGLISAYLTGKKIESLVLKNPEKEYEAITYDNDKIAYTSLADGFEYDRNGLWVFGSNRESSVFTYRDWHCVLNDTSHNGILDLDGHVAVTMGYRNPKLSGIKIPYDAGIVAQIKEKRAKLIEIIKQVPDMREDIASIDLVKLFDKYGDTFKTFSKELRNLYYSLFSKSESDARTAVKEAYKEWEKEHNNQLAKKAEEVKSELSSIANEMASLQSQKNAININSPLPSQATNTNQTAVPEYATEAQEAEYSREEASEFGDNTSEREYYASDWFERFYEDFHKKHKKFSFKDLIQAIKFLQEKDYSKLFDEGTKKQVNEKLSNALEDILRKYGFDIVEGDLSKAFGDDVQGAFDVLQKIVYLANKKDRSAIVDAEEFSHAFIKMMGAVWHKPENRKKYAETKVYSELVDEIEKTSFYKDVIDLYGNDANYQYANGRLNRRKLQEEAIGKALAATLVERAEMKEEADKSFLAKLKKWFNDVLVWVKSKITDYGKFERQLNQIADSILAGTYAEKYLNKLNDKGYELQDYATTIQQATERDGGLALGIMQRVSNLGGVVTGSISYRAQGTVYRKDIDSLHDIDTVWSNKTTNIFSEHPELFRANISDDEVTRIVLENGKYQEFVSAYDNMELIAAYKIRDNSGLGLVANLIMCDDAALRERFKNLSGNFNYRLAQFTEEEQGKIHLVDMFFNSKDNLKEYEDTQFGLKLTDYTESFRAKLALSRPKDLYDYQRFVPTHRTYAAVEGDIMLSKQRKDNGRVQIDEADKQYIKETVKLGNNTVNGAELQEVINQIEAIHRDSNLAKNVRVPFVEWSKLNTNIFYGNTRTLAGFIGRLESEYGEGKIQYDKYSKTQSVPGYWYEIMKVLNQHQELFNTLVKSLDMFDEEYADTDFGFDTEYGLLEQFLYEPRQLFDALDSTGVIDYKYEDSRQGTLFDEQGRPAQPEAAPSEVITDENGYSYTRINPEFKNVLLEHLRQEKSGFYRLDKTRDSLVTMANALFDFFEREGFKIVITNNPYDSNGRGSVVSSFGKYVTIYYQDDSAQGNKYLNILHELLHVATNQAISWDSMGRDVADPRLSTYYNLFVAKLHEDPQYLKYRNILSKVRSYKEMDEKVPLKYQILDHAASKPGEFISCCISNKEVQEVLESIAYTDVDMSEEGTLFGQIKRWFKDILEKIFRGTSLTGQDFLEDLTSFLTDVKYSGDQIGHMDEETAKAREQFLESRWGNAKEFVAPARQAPVIPETKPRIDEVYQNKIQRVVREINNLLNSNVPVNEVRDEANKAMDWISDQLTQYQENPEKVWNKYFRDTEDPSRKDEIVKKVSTMSREDLLGMCGVDRMLRFYSEEVLKMNDNNVDAYLDFTPEESEKYNTLIPNNLTALVQLGYSRFLDREGFGIVFSETGDDMYSTQKGKALDEAIIVDDYNNENDVDNNSEEEGNQQEHWQIESRTREILATASSLVRNTISSLYQLIETDRKNPDGTPVYDNKTDKLGRNERVAAVTAVRSIVKWTQGASSLSDMVNILSEKVGENPWVSQLITKLADRTGKESDFQSQFFTTFYRHFQPYTIVTVNENGKFYSKPVNEHPALDDAIKTLRTEYKLGRLPLFNSAGIDRKNLELFKSIIDTLEGQGKYSKSNKDNVIELTGRILKAVGFPYPTDAIGRIMANGIKNTVLEKATAIYDTLIKEVNNKAYDPFKYGDNSNGITGYLRSLLQPFTTPLEDVMVSSVYDSGKMYQSFVTPSWTTKLFSNMHLDEERFSEFLLDEFGSSEWFVRDTSLLGDLTSEEANKMSAAELKRYRANYLREHAADLFRNTWLAKIASMDAADRQEAFTHRVELNFDKSNYMRGMNHLQYTLSVFTEFFSKSANDKNRKTEFAFYRFPMLSNKPSNEFVKMVKFTGMNMEDSILDGFMEVFNQEVSRIQTVRIANLKKGDPGFVTNLSEERGRQFCFLDYLNRYLEDTESTIGELLDRKLSGDKNRMLSSEEELCLGNLVREQIKDYLDERTRLTQAEYEKNGIAEALKKVSNITNVNEAIKEFVWNDVFAQSQLLELLITDKAMYSNEEDVQKRLAQVHSPGIRGNWEALDYGEPENGIAPRNVSDGKVRAIKLTDYNNFISDTLDNLMEVFDRKIEEAPESEKNSWRDLKDSVKDAYSHINVVDGQAFVSPSAYRKHAIAFGEWSRDAEKVYNELKEGRYNLSSLQSVFNPRKPFTYGKVTKQVSVNPNLDTPIKTWNYGVQYKNSEYLLIMANAMLAGQHTSKPNILGALFDVLEESYDSDYKEGLDFVIFESGVKTGLSGAISLNGLVDLKEGQRLAKAKLESLIYQGGRKGNAYNENYVDVLDAMDYVNQQPVPEHFMDSDGLQWGSQERVIMPSDLEREYLGNPVVFEYKDDRTGEMVRKDRDGMREEWENTTAQIINDSVERLREELGIDENSNLSQKEKNIILSKILQREILANSRYGVDLLLACSVDEDGNFRIPLGDPIQSKRIEQLISSIIKNRVNKIKVEGGTLVEVSNFGMSRRLEIRYHDKKGGLLERRSDYLAKGHTEAEFKEYLKNNQAGIAYHECYAPAWAREVFQNFSDEFGNIDIEAIEMVDPDLLLMFGYRIPTEDKYSCAPYKIVGFLPKEAGDGFMQPWDVTAVDGSDFDVDKKNLMRMVIQLKSKLLSKSQFAKEKGLTDEKEINKKYSDYRKEHGPSVKNIVDRVADKLPDKLSNEDEEMLQRDTQRKRESLLKEAETLRDKRNEDALDTYNRRYESEVAPMEERYNALEAREDLTGKEEDQMKRLDKSIDKLIKKLERDMAKAETKNEEAYQKSLEIIEAEVKDFEETSRKALLSERRTDAVREILRDGIFRNSGTVTENKALFKAVKQAYLDLSIETVKPTEGKGYLNNKIFRMQWAIATHESTADKMLNPQNFDIQKKVGYTAEAFRAGLGDWDTLWGKSVKELKKMIQTQKNLMDFLTQTQFYKQNSVAAQILGIFAVARSAHAMYEGRNYHVKIQGNPFFLGGMRFGGYMEIDPMHDRTGTNLVGKNLGSLVGASADAVKDPVLNFMNINKETVNVLTAALRLGMDFETVSLLLSSKKISEALDNYNRTNLVRKTSFDRIVKNMIRDMLKENKELAVLNQQELTRDEMIEGIREPSEEIAYKTLYIFSRLSSISNDIQPTTDMSRLNSVKSAVGPQYINTLASDRKFTQPIKSVYKITGKQYVRSDDGRTVTFGDIIKGTTVRETNADMLVAAGVLKVETQYDKITVNDIFDDIPSLRAFYQGYSIAKEYFKDMGILTATGEFQKVTSAIDSDLEFKIWNNPKLLSSLADFFQSYIVVASGAVKSKMLKYYTQDFAKEFVEGNYKNKYANNPFISAIKPTMIVKEGVPDKLILTLDTTGMEQTEKDALSAGWIQLEKENPQLSHRLFYYNFFRGGIGFSPKTFMGLVPLQVKENIPGYIDALQRVPEVSGTSVFEQWIRNNWNNPSLVTFVDGVFPSNDGKLRLKGKNYSKSFRNPYIRIRVDGEDRLFKRTSDNPQGKLATYTEITPLGNNREYLEIYTDNKGLSKPGMERTNRALPEVVDSEQLEMEVDDYNDVQETDEEQTEALKEFLDSVLGENAGYETYEERLRRNFEEQTNDLDITTDNSKFEEELDKFC